MKFTLKIVDDVCVLKLDGRFMTGGDGFFLKQKVQHILGMGIRKLVVDMDQVPHIDSTGVGFLVSSHTSITQDGGRLELLKVKPKILEVLKVMNLLPSFEIFDDEEAAMRSFTNNKKAGARKKKKPVKAKKEKV